MPQHPTATQHIRRTTDWSGSGIQSVNENAQDSAMWFGVFDAMYSGAADSGGETLYFDQTLIETEAAAVPDQFSAVVPSSGNEAIDVRIGDGFEASIVGVALRVTEKAFNDTGDLPQKQLQALLTANQLVVTLPDELKSRLGSDFIGDSSSHDPTPPFLQIMITVNYKAINATLNIPEWRQSTCTILVSAQKQTWRPSATPTRAIWENWLVPQEVKPPHQFPKAAMYRQRLGIPLQDHPNAYLTGWAGSIGSDGVLSYMGIQFEDPDAGEGARYWLFGGTGLPASLTDHLGKVLPDGEVNRSELATVCVVDQGHALTGFGLSSADDMVIHAVAYQQALIPHGTDLGAPALEPGLSPKYFPEEVNPKRFQIQYIPEENNTEVITEIAVGNAKGPPASFKSMYLDTAELVIGQRDETVVSG